MAAPAPDVALHRLNGAAFGGSFLLASSDEDDLPRAAAVLDEFERTLSRFRSDSALARLNREGRLAAPPPLLVACLQAAQEAALFTNGLVDATILPSLEAAGYDRTFADVRDGAGGSLSPHRPVTGRIRISERAVELPRGCRVDLGGVAKGLAVDHALAAMRGTRALVNAAGDVRVRGGGFAVDLQVLPDARHPLDTTVRLDGGALATSGVTRRHWVGPDGARRHHLIDPRTGAPADSPWLVATVWAPTCLEADVRAKEAFLLGADAPARLTELGLAGRLIGRDGTAVGAGAWA
jgi:thiamine biosynthesis lipoprotein